MLFKSAYSDHDLVWYKRHLALFVIICNKPWPITMNARYQVFSSYGDVENIARFHTMGDFHARVNFHSPRDAVNAFCKLQGCRIYEDCCELDLYFASEFICGCRPYIPSYKLDCERPRTPIIPWQHSIEDYKVSSQRFSKKTINFLFGRDKSNMLRNTWKGGNQKGNFSRWAYKRACPRNRFKHGNWC